MKLFGEEVKHTSTNSLLNIIQVENFDEIFFDVFEVELNNRKLPLEKVSEYRGNPVVNLPIVVEEDEVMYPFILVKGKYSILFNKENTDLPIEEKLIDLDITEEEILSESKQEILEQIQSAKRQAEEVLRINALEKAKILSSKTKKNNKLLSETLKKAKESLVFEFIDISNKLRKEIIDNSLQEYSEINESIDNKLSDIREDLKNQLELNFENVSDIFDKKIKSLVKELYIENVSPKVDKELKSIAKEIVEKVGEIEINLTEKLSEKADQSSVDDISNGLFNIQKSSIELNNTLNKGVNKALSRAGNVKNLVERIDKELNTKITEELANVEKYFDEKLVSLQEQTVEYTEESRKYIINLVNEARQGLLEEIKTIPREKPIEYIIESNKKNPEKVNLDKLKKEYDSIIHDKFENYKTDLRRYISVYSGGGSVAQQFAAGGEMGGNLIVHGSISASNYLGISVPSGDYLSLSGGEINGNLIIGGTLSASDYAGITWDTIEDKPSTFPPDLHGHDYLPLSGGTVTGSVSANNLVYNTGDQNISGDKTFTDDVIVNGQITSPNQTDSTPDSVLTRALADVRYSSNIGLLGPASITFVDVASGFSSLAINTTMNQTALAGATGLRLATTSGLSVGMTIGTPALTGIPLNAYITAISAAAISPLPNISISTPLTADVPAAATINTVVLGGASVASNTRVLVATTATTLGSEASLMYAAFNPAPFTYPGEFASGGNAGINFDKKTYFGFKITVTHGSNWAPITGSDAWVRMGCSRTYRKYGAPEAPNKAVGIWRSTGSYYPWVMDGTTLNLSPTPIYTNVSGLNPVSLIEIVGEGAASGNYRFYVNGTLQQTLSGGPTGYSSQEGTQFAICARNLTGIANSNLSIGIANGQFVFTYLE